MCLSKGEKDLERFLEIKGKNFFQKEKEGILLERF